MKKFCKSLGEQVKDIIDFKKKNTLPLIKKELNLHQDATSECCICRKRFIRKFAKDKNHRKVRDHCHFTGKYRSAAHSFCNLRFNIPNYILVVFHNGSNYDYH